MALTRVSPGVVKVEREAMTISERLYLPQVIGVLEGMLAGLGHAKGGRAELAALPAEVRLGEREVDRELADELRCHGALGARREGRAPREDRQGPRSPRLV